MPRVSLCLMRWGTKSQSVRPDVVDSEEAMQNSTTMHNKCLEFAQQSSQWVNMDQNSSLHSAEIDLQDPSRMSWHIAFIALEGN